MIYVIGPGHGGPGWWRIAISKAPTRSVIPISNATGMGCNGCFGSSPGPMASRVTSRRKRLGRSMKGASWVIPCVHAYGAAFDNPDLIVACIIGDGEAETGALAASWHSNKFLNPARDGAVLPILHLNGFKIANPTVLARISRQELTDLMRGYGYEPHFVERDVPAVVHQSLAATLDRVLARDSKIPEFGALLAGRGRTAALAHDRLPHPKRLDGAEARRRQAGGGDLARPSGSDRASRKARASQTARRVDEKLQTG